MTVASRLSWIERTVTQIELNVVAAVERLLAKTCSKGWESQQPVAMT